MFSVQYRCAPCQRAAVQAKRNSREGRIKDFAVQQVARAIRNGELTPQPCEGQGGCSRTPVFAHHDDYSKPLSVRWLCAVCHVWHHKEHGPGLIPQLAAAVEKQFGSNESEMPKKFHPTGLPEPIKQVANYPAHLRGLAHTTLNKQRGFKGSTFGPAGKGRRLSVDEVTAVEKQLRAKGEIQ